ncbi:MAG: hypothetical protein U9O95_02560 [Candidatus Marinimicrobia bacterium]|nr:hypothetical protein [Candidatus Neomarinimicrobiota bacterium]
MIFTNTSRNISVELLGISSCKLTVIDEDLKQLDGINRLLNAYVREAPLDGGIPVQFEHGLNLEEKYITFTGNLIDVVYALRELDRLDDSLRDDITEQIVLDTMRQAFDTISAEKREGFITKLRATIEPEQQPTAPGLHQ